MNIFLYKISLKVLFITICVNILFSEQDTSIILGCTNSFSNNYNPEATQDDGSCIYGFNINFSDSIVHDFEKIAN